MSLSRHADHTLVVVPSFMRPHLRFAVPVDIGVKYHLHRCVRDCSREVGQLQESQEQLRSSSAAAVSKATARASTAEAQRAQLRRQVSQLTTTSSNLRAENDQLTDDIAKQKASARRDRQARSNVPPSLSLATYSHTSVHMTQVCVCIVTWNTCATTPQ